MTQGKVAVVTDSTANIPPHLIEQYNIHVIPQIVNWEGESYRDGVDLHTDEFYDRLATAKEIPTTSQPSPGQFHQFFTEIAQTADSIVGVFISEFLSGTLASAHQAAAMMEGFPIEIVDTRSASMGLGFMVLAAARALEEGATAQEAADAARALIPHMNVFFVVDTLEFLHKGGRIGGAQRLVGSMLAIKPVLHLVDGKIEPLASIRTKKKAIRHLLDHAREELAGKGAVHACVIHSVAPKDAQKIQTEIADQLGPQLAELVTTDLSPVIGTHTGPGAVGLICYAEPD